MSNLVPREISPRLLAAQYRRTSRDLAVLHHQTAVRMASVQAEGVVQTEKMHEIDHLTREAMSGHAMLRKWSDVLASGDPFFADELRFFTDAARLGKGEVLADTIDSFCRESRR
jgi:hypothetical protein